MQSFQKSFGNQSLWQQSQNEVSVVDDVIYEKFYTTTTRT